MRGLETLNAQPQTSAEINVEAFWAPREQMLKEKGQRPLDYIREILLRADGEIYEMPEELFDPAGDEASALRKTHVLLDFIVSEPEQAYTEAVAKAILPYWAHQLEDARDWLGTL